MSDEEHGDVGRSPKRLKTAHSASNGNGNGDARGQHKTPNGYSQKPLQARGKGRGKSRPGLTISASGIHSGDVGVFVTCDKGNERKCLTELGDLIGQYLEDDQVVDHDVDHHGVEENTAVTAAVKEADIESDILAELESMKPQARHAASSSTADQVATPGLQLITLDIPCVSFVRLPKTASIIDPVQLVQRICTDAARDPNRQRSRYIKRLTPVSAVRKTLSNGLDEVCDAVLPAVFGGSETNAKGFKFAIRPTIRNNDKLGRDEVIKTVATKIGDLGGFLDGDDGQVDAKEEGEPKKKARHTVDLKHYDKCVLVEVYRNIVGMCVVDGKGSEVVDDDGQQDRFGYEELKRWNLAEIYQSRRSK